VEQEMRTNKGAAGTNENVTNLLFLKKN